MKTITYNNPQIRPHYRRIAKLLLIGLSIYYIFNPISLMRHTKAVFKYVGRKGEQIHYEYIRETKGDLFYNMATAKKEWSSFGRGMGKAGQDFIGFFTK